MKFERYHALGNDYLVMDPQEQPSSAQAGLTDAQVIRICHRHFGVGSDGILWGNLANAAASGQAFGLRILNPDASEAEKSGNGLRIFCRYLYDTQQVGEAPFEVWTQGGVVQAQILQQGKQVRVAVGQARFTRGALPMLSTQAGQSAADEVLGEAFQLANERLQICVANLGNPHCVVLREAQDLFDADTVRRLGPLLEHHPAFPNRTNVQLLKVLDRRNIQIEIWERGAGYTLASGTSSSACAAVAKRMGWVDERLTVHMPGGQLQIEVDSEFKVTMTGSVTRIASGQIYPECLE